MEKNSLFFEKGSTRRLPYAQAGILHNYESFLKKRKLDSLPYYNWGVGIKNKGSFWLWKDIQSWYVLGATDEVSKNVPHVPQLPFLGVSFKTQSAFTLPHKSFLNPIPSLNTESEIKNFFNQQNKIASAIETLGDGQVQSTQDIQDLIQEKAVKIENNFSQFKHDIKEMLNVHRETFQEIEQKQEDILSAIENHGDQSQYDPSLNLPNSRKMVQIVGDRYSKSDAFCFYLYNSMCFGNGNTMYSWFYILSSEPFRKRRM